MILALGLCGVPWGAPWRPHEGARGSKNYIYKLPIHRNAAITCRYVICGRPRGQHEELLEVLVVAMMSDGRGPIWR